MTIMESVRRMSLLPLLGLIYFSFLCCTSNGKKTRDLAQSPQTTLTVHLASEPSREFSAIRLNIASFKLATQDGRHEKTLAVNRECDLQLKDRPALATMGPIERQAFRQGRILLSPERGVHKLTPLQDNEQPLVIPAQIMENGIPVTLPEGLFKGERTELMLVIDAGRSIQVERPNGARGAVKYTLRPRVWAGAVALSPSVKGRVNAAQGDLLEHVPITVQVEAQVPAAPGGQAQAGAARPMTVVRSARSRAGGEFDLDLLPLPAGKAFHLVSQLTPDRGGVKAVASEALHANTREAQAGGLEVAAAEDARGTLDGSILTRLGPDEYDQVDILQALPAGSSSTERRLFVVHSVPVETVEATGRFKATLPPGTYEVRQTRFKTGSQGESILVSPHTQPCEVRQGQTIAVQFGSTPPAPSTATPSTSRPDASSATPSTTRPGTASATPSTTRTGASSTTPSTTPTSASSATPSTTPTGASSATPSTTRTGASSATPSTTRTGAAMATPSTTRPGASSATPSTTRPGTASATPSTTPTGASSATPSTTPTGASSATPSTTRTDTSSATPSTTPTGASSATPSTTRSGTRTRQAHP